MKHLLFFVVAMLGCHLALAQNVSVTTSGPALSTNTSPATNASSAAKRDDIVKLMKLTRMEQQIQTVFAQFKKAMPDVTESEWRELQAEAKPDELIALAMPIYDRHLTHEEVKNLIAFYETPLGQKSLDRMALITTELMQAGQEWGQRMIAKIEKKNPKPPVAKTRTGPLTREEKDSYIRLKGLDPELYDIDDNTVEIVRRPPKPPAQEPMKFKVKGNLRYLITVRDGNSTTDYYSEKEPKPYGNGYKVQDLRGFEVTVSGDVKIIRLSR